MSKLMGKWQISQHARKRIKQRMGIPYRGQAHLLKNFRQKSLTLDYMPASIRMWVAMVLTNSNPGCQCYIYDNVLFVTNHRIIITVLPVPPQLQPMVQEGLANQRKDV